MYFIIIKQLSRLLAKVVELKGEVIVRQADTKVIACSDQLARAEIKVTELEELLEKAEQDLRDLQASYGVQKLSAVAASSVCDHYKDHAATIREFYPAVAREEKAPTETVRSFKFYESGGRVFTKE